ncbi:MAG: M48 family metallopeptidase [Coprobacillus sp.]|nr:M48 family metallopeptidase [Coprobacillus sp.]
MKKESTYIVNGREYKVNIFYQKQKRTYYRFINGEFKVTCPLSASLKEINRGLDKFALKLIERAKTQELYGPSFIYLFGYRYEITLPKGYIEFSNYPYIEYDDKEELTKELKALLLKIINSRVTYYEKLMGIVDPYKVRVREMKTRWGTNSKKTHTLTFSMMLIHYDEEVIDSVIVHELAHYFYFDHSKNFYNVVYKYYPHYDEVQTRLKKGIRND